jgi:hypothetical protein
MGMGLGMGGPSTAFPPPPGVAPMAPPGAADWGQQAPMAPPQAFPPPPGAVDAGGYGAYGGGGAAPGMGMGVGTGQGWQQQPQQQPIAVGGGGSYGDRGNYARRKALLIGISYRNSIRPLGGCINDVKNVRQFIVERYGFPTSPDSMVILTDEGREDSAHLPTKANILRWMKWLVEDARAGDSLFLHYSGHGGQTPDRGADGDEIDGMDETILPVDYEKAGQIVDDDMHQILIKHLKPGVRMTVIFDSCHSGTALDLPYVYDNHGNIVCSPEMVASAGGAAVKPAAAQASNYTYSTGGGYSTGGSSYYTSAPTASTSYYQSNPTVQYHARKKHKWSSKLGNMFMGLSGSMMGQRGLGDDGGTTDRDYSYQAHISRISQADVVMFSGCSDEQTSADTSIQGSRTGAMSYAFIATLRANPQGVTYAALLGQMRDILASQAFGQVPQLSSSHPMNMAQPFNV